MRSSNQTEIREAFSRQAGGFESDRMNFSNKEFLSYAVAKIAPKKTDTVLEAAAGTCVCGRALAPYVSVVTCLDMTPAMLDIGKEAAKQAHIENIRFVIGDAAELPFPDNGFDIVLSRLAFHHFPDRNQPFTEMVRVLKPGRKLVLIDMDAAEEPLRDTEDAMERMRDPSHVRNLSRAEMLSLYHENGLSVSCCETVRMPMVLQNWLDHTKTPEPIQREIRTRMEDELSGGKKTGFSPYRRDGEICFDHRWTLIIGNTGTGGVFRTGQYDSTDIA